MKKIFLIIVLIFSFQNNLLAENFNKFNKWLLKNGYSQYVSSEQKPICKEEPKYSQAWYYNECDKFSGSNNLNIKIDNKALSATNIAYHSNPNRDTLIYYCLLYTSDAADE